MMSASACSAARAAVFPSGFSSGSCAFSCAFFWALLLLPGLSPAHAASSYEFLAAPQTDLNRVYRIDRETGEVGACQYGLRENAVGVTLCYPSGEGAGPQAPSDYTLVSSRHEREAGVFRVNLRTGLMSICYVLNDAVVCTPPAK
jgi:hypothetical protein